MRKLWIFFFVIAQAGIITITPEAAAPEATVINVNVENRADSHVIFPSPPKKMRCSESKNGNELKECIQGLRKDKRKKILQKLPKQLRHAFIQSLTRDEYKDAFLALFSEQEWRTFLANLSPAEQKKWPKTIQEQLNVLAEIKKNGDADYYYNASIDTVLDLVFMPPPLSCVLVTLDCRKNAKRAIEKEEEAFKNYKEEKFS